MDIQNTDVRFEAHIKRIYPDLPAAWYKPDENGRYPEGMQQDWELWQAAKADSFIEFYTPVTADSTQFDAPQIIEPAQPVNEEKEAFEAYCREELTSTEIEFTAHALDCKIDELIAEISEKNFMSNESEEQLQDLVDEAIKLGELYGWRDAKANAIPEGFILVPKELTHEQAVKISDDPEFFEIYQNIVTDSDTSEDSVSVLLRVAHKVMAKAKEPSIEK